MDCSQKLDCTGFYGVIYPLSAICPKCQADDIPVAPLLTIGLFGFAWTSLGPPHVHWIAPMIFSTLIAIANVSGLNLVDTISAEPIFQFSIYMATVDYMIASYGPYSASATGGNGFARDFLAGVAAMYSVPSK